MSLKRLLVKFLQDSYILTFLRILYILVDIKKILILRRESNFSEKVVCVVKITQYYASSGISLNERYAATIGEQYLGTTSIPCTKVTSIH